MAEPPAELHEPEHQRAVERRREGRETHHDGEVGRAAREQERACRTDCERDEHRETGDEQRDRRGGSRLGDCGHETRDDDREQPKRDDGHRERRLHRERPPDRRRRREQRRSREHQDRRPDGQGQCSGQRHHPVVADEDGRRRQAVDGEQRGHRRERRAHRHRAGVASAGAEGGQRHCRSRRDRGCRADEVEVHPHRGHHHALADGREQQHGHRGRGSERREDGGRASVGHRALPSAPGKAA